MRSPLRATLCRRRLARRPSDTIQKHARKTPEIVQAYDRLEGQFIGCSTAALARICDKGMQRISNSLMGALLGISLVTAAVGASDAKVAPITRTERCSNLSRQLDEALETHATATQVTAARALQRKGNRYCANKKGTGHPDARQRFEAAWSDTDRPGSVTLISDLHKKEVKP